MDYTPRFSQPFTLAEAIRLDVPVITEGGYSEAIYVDSLTYAHYNEEISRLQTSLTRLKETQGILEVELEGSGEVDPEITKAFEENIVVIGSQEERISMLKMALTDKGITTGSHYDTPTMSPSQPMDKRISHSSQTLAPQLTSHGNASEADGGVFL